MLEDVIVDHNALEALRHEFDTLGYVVLRNTLDPDAVADLLDATQALHVSHADHPHRNPAPNGFNMRPVIDKHPAFLQLLINHRAFALICRLLDHFNIQLMQSHLFEANPGTDTRVTGWHNDGGEPALEVNGVRAFGSLKIGYFLRDRLQDNMGSLMVVPGSHRVPGAPHTVPGAADPVGAVQIKAAAGDAIVFHQGVWHASAPNLAAEARVILYYGYGYRILRPIDYVAMPDALLQRCDPVQRQLLGETHGHQGYHLPDEKDTPLKAWYETYFGAPSNRGNLQRPA